MGLSSRELGEALGVSHTAVNKAAKRGRIPREADGTFDLVKVKAVWEKNADQYQRQRGLKAKPAVTAKRHKSAAPPTGEGDGSDVSFFEAQRQREWIRVAKEELELDLKKGKLILAEDAESGWSRLVSTIQNGFLLLGAKVAPRLPGDPRENQAIIDRAVKEILSELSNTKAAA